MGRGRGAAAVGVAAVTVHANYPGLGTASPSCPDTEPVVRASAEFLARADACPRCVEAVRAISECIASVRDVLTGGQRKAKP